MKKIYQSPSILALEIEIDGMLCQGSAKGGVQTGSIVEEEEVTMVKSNSYNTNPVQWEDWQ